MDGDSQAVERANSSKLPPLFFGRSTRIAFGLTTLGAAVVFGAEALSIAGFVALVLLGVSFLVGGLIGNPGCELSALPNLVLPRSKRFHFR